MRKLGISTLSVLGVLVLGGLSYATYMIHLGFSTRTRPSRVEALLATAMLDASIPARYTKLRNPVPETPGSIHEGMAHFADHCAICHSNNGSGDSMLGKTMYPRPPNLAGAETQSRSDGELYYPIQYGIRLSGMPAFGDPRDDDPETWKLVAFLRHLPKLSAAEEAEMERLNPKGPEEWREEQEEDQFLNGTASPAQTATHHQKRGHER